MLFNNFRDAFFNIRMEQKPKSIHITILVNRVVGTYSELRGGGAGLKVEETTPIGLMLIFAKVGGGGGQQSKFRGGGRRPLPTPGSCIPACLSWYQAAGINSKAIKGTDRPDGEISKMV